MNARRLTLATLCLTTAVLLALAVPIIGCENVPGPPGSFVAEGPQPNPGPTLMPGPRPGEGMPPDGNPGEMMPPGENPGEGNPSGPNPPTGAPPTTKKTTATTAGGGNRMEALPLPTAGGALMEALPLTATRYEETDPHLAWSGSDRTAGV